MRTYPEEIPLSNATINKIYRAVDGELVLVGGQALSFWMYRYSVSDEGSSFITRDVDFLAFTPTAIEQVKKIAKAMGGQVSIPDEKAITALVGQAFLFLDEEKTKVHNVDVIFQVIGIKASEVFDRSIDLGLADKDDTIKVKVMHPEHVLESRFYNLVKLSSKNTPLGHMQLRAAITVLREYIMQDVLGTEEGMKRAVGIYSRTLKLAGTKQAQKMADDLGIHLADSISLNALPENHPFLIHQAERAMALMSNSYRLTQSHQIKGGPKASGPR